MSLATRCTSCGTIFRVVQDQLKVSEGWVRCGRCDAVFQATEGLFDLEHEAPPSWAGAEVSSGYEPERGPPADPPRPRETPLEEPPSPAPRVAAPIEAPTSAEATLRALSAAAAAADADADAIVVPRERRLPAEAPAPVPPPPEAASAIVEHERREGWQGGRVGAGLSAVALLLLVLLAGQAAQRFSDIAAARWPALRAALGPWCRLTGCSLAAPRRIEAILVDSTSLTPQPGTDTLRLAIGLRNREAHAVALPSVDLSLTDTTGQLIARRTLRPADFRVGVDALAARAELPLQALVSAGGERVTGYAVEIFYP